MSSSRVGADYFSAMSIPLLAGREFTADIEGVASPAGAEQEPPAIINLILNLAATRALGFAAPELAVDSFLTVDSLGLDNVVESTQQARVIGVVGDTQFGSLLAPPSPDYYRFTSTGIWLAVKLESGADADAVVAELREIWEKVTGQTTLPLAVIGNDLAREEFEASVIIGSALMALIIALLGLYGLVEATVNKRTKEIGVRKALGASRASIVVLFLWQFSKPVIAANLIAWPLGLWGVMRWLQRFPYQLDLGVILSLALAASLAALGIAWLTIAILATRAASVRPVRALRYE
jgi:putative ABC transport system permease protein